MKVHFKIPYYTYWGQRLLVSGDIPELGNGDLTKALVLNYQSPEDWYAEIEVNRTEVIQFNYKYVLFNEQTGQYTEEWGEDRQLTIDSAKADHLFCIDVWNSPGSIDNVFLTTPFQKVLLSHDNLVGNIKSATKYTHIFKVKMPLLKNNETICLIGDCDALGNWSTNNPVLLTRADNNWWKVEVDLSKARNEVHYKYGIYDLENKQFRYFESGPDHIVPIIKSRKALIQKSDGFVRVSNNSWKGAGVGLPVFSIRTKKSFGVGDFADIKLLVDWAEKVGLKLIQVLPLNDTIGTHTDADVLLTPPFLLLR